MSGRCPICEEIIPGGPNCAVDDTTCFGITGSGTAASPYVIDVILSPNAAQIATCDTDGLRGIVPTSITNRSACQAYNSAGQSITNNTLTTVALNSETYDTDTMHNPTTNNSRMTFSTAGVYAVTFNCAWNKNTTGDRLCQLLKNNANILVQDVRKTGGADLIVGHSLTLVDLFAANDYIEAKVQQTSGGNLTLLSESYSPVMTATRTA